MTHQLPSQRLWTFLRNAASGLVLQCLFCVTVWAQQPATVSGQVTSSDDNDGIPGVNVLVSGTTLGTVTDIDGRYTISVPAGSETLSFSFIGYVSQDVPINGRTEINVVMETDIRRLDEVVVVGYGTQRRSDITGAVASLPQDRLERVPNINIAQAIQGAIPGVMMSTNSAGAAPDEAIMIRGRNSILASNSPLIVVDGIPYGGQLRDINPSDVKSIEVLKDASAAAIYGSRGSNGVILVTTKLGTAGTPKVGYSGYYSVQRFSNLPNLMNGEEFYKFKMERDPSSITQSEIEVYESGEWVDWLDLALRNGRSMQHNVTVSGGSEKTQYYISGGLTDVKGLAVNDDYQRLTTRVNLDTKIANWLTIGTRTQFSFDDRSGIAPTWDGDQGVFWMNPLTRAFDENGDLTIFPWADDVYFRNPLMGTLADDIDESYQAVLNNYAVVDFPFVKGLQYRINVGTRLRFTDRARYYGRNTQLGLNNRGDAYTNRGRYNSSVIENVLNYRKEIGKHNIFVTGLYSFQEDASSQNILSATGFPHDFLTWYSAGQAELIVPDYTYSNTVVLSQMVRINYGYDSRYLLTVTGRRDGYSGFGAKTKWGLFPSVALGWNISREAFFPATDVVSDLKLRSSYGLNGNQAVDAYETISRLAERNIVEGPNTLPGYIPNKLGEDNLGWESTRSLNFGIDYGLLGNRITGDVNYYRSNTTDLLLTRTLSPVQGIPSITQNIGKTRNTGFEFSVTSRNLTGGDVEWTTSANFSTMKNEIVSLYGEISEDGTEVNDLANRWFIGSPVLVNFGYVWDGVWQTEEAELADLYGVKPGSIRIKDINGDTLINADDRQIIGQQDPKVIWGMNNTVSYKNFTLSVFLHGVHGATKHNVLMSDNVFTGVRRNTTLKNWWTPENASNDWYRNEDGAHVMGGVTANRYEDAGFVRIRDISLAYNLPNTMLEQLGMDRLQLYVTGRNLFTFTKWGGLDPELDGQRSIPLQKEFVVGLNLGF